MSLLYICLRIINFVLCDAPPTFQKSLSLSLSLFLSLLILVKEIVKVFIDDLFVQGTSFNNCLHNLNKVLRRCVYTGLALTWKKCCFMVIEGVLLGHRISGKGIEIDSERIEVIENCPILMM